MFAIGSQTSKMDTRHGLIEANPESQLSRFPTLSEQATSHQSNLPTWSGWIQAFGMPFGAAERPRSSAKPDFKLSDSYYPLVNHRKNLPQPNPPFPH